MIRPSILAVFRLNNQLKFSGLRQALMSKCDEHRKQKPLSEGTNSVEHLVQLAKKAADRGDWPTVVESMKACLAATPGDAAAFEWRVLLGRALMGSRCYAEADAV